MNKINEAIKILRSAKIDYDQAQKVANAANIAKDIAYNAWKIARKNFEETVEKIKEEAETTNGH